jgi:nitroreductase
MNETFRVINSRRSIRKFKKDQIANSVLQDIVNTGLYAPNAMNQQKWHFTVIQNKALIDRMVSIIKQNIMKSGIEFLIQRASSPDYHTFHHAPAVILISGDEKTPFLQVSCGAAAENIALASESLNIGTCVITSSVFLFASEENQALKKELGIPEGYNHICTIALGYKDGEIPSAPPRNKDVINYIK